MLGTDIPPHHKKVHFLVFWKDFMFLYSCTSVLMFVGFAGGMWQAAMSSDRSGDAQPTAQPDV